MARVLFVHWKAEEAEARVKPLRRAGHEVECYSTQGGDGLRELRADPPEAVVIDLERLPSHGRAVGTFLRQQKATRNVPLVFVEGEAAKTRRVREELPDAHFTDRAHVRGALRRALRNPPGAPCVPGTMQGYSGTLLPKKLGLSAEGRTILIGAPRGFETTLGELPGGARLTRSARGRAAVVVLFTRKRADLRARWAAATRAVEPGGRLWIAWPKQASGLQTDLSGNGVRAHGLGKGWVDFKICAIDETWSGLCFSKRKKKSA